MTPSHTHDVYVDDNGRVRLPRNDEKVRGLSCFVPGQPRVPVGATGSCAAAVQACLMCDARKPPHACRKAIDKSVWVVWSSTEMRKMASREPMAIQLACKTK